MNPYIIFLLLHSNADDLLAIEKCIGGLGSIIKLEPQLYAIYSAYEKGGAEAVLESCGPNVQAIIETIGPPNIAAVLPRAAKILKTIEGATAAK